MQKIFPFLWFNDQAEEAVHFYTALFPNSAVSEISRFGDNVPGPKGKVMTIRYTLNGQEFMALNGGPEFAFTPAISFFVNCQTRAEIDGLWAKLAQGGAVLMEKQAYPFSAQFGWLVDRFGVSWQLNLSSEMQKIYPFLMFVKEQCGKAAEAIKFYTSIFENSRIITIERYGKGEAEPEGNVKHARFALAGEEFMAMESSADHQFTFTPAISFYVNCETQAEIDYFWEKLLQGGQPEMCGWLKDRYGISWQIVPTLLGELMNDPDKAKADRVTQAMLKMVKLDIAGLKQAYEA